MAFFARNYPEYLEEAKTIGARDPSKRIVFRSKSRWASADRHLGRLGALPIYLSANGAEGEVEYRAELCDVLLDPVPGSPKAERWLTDVLASTDYEKLWDESVTTLYAIRGCQMLSQPFPITRLIKLSNGEPISADFKYSYAIVRAIDDIK